LAKRVADIIIDSLIASGVKRIYGVSGDSLNGITDAVRERGKEKISWIHVRQC
jgi:pyruvate dehydrogenase (quinone)